METNNVTLSGVVLDAQEVRYSPAGIPHRRFVLEHRSRQVEASHPREVTCKMAVEVRGALVARYDALIRVGERVEVRGFLDRGGHRDDHGARLILHAQQMMSTGEAG